MIFKYLVVAILFAQLSASDRAAIDRYKAATTIEGSFASIRGIREALLTKLETLPEAEFNRLKQDLAGLIVNREEIVFIKPDVEYFTKLAASRGDVADRAFFAALKATYPESVWPTYVEQQTDYAGCTRYGSGSLVEAYRAWSEFQRRYPGRYVDAAREEVAAVLEQVTQSTCACGNAAAIQRELEDFLRQFPTSPAKAGVEQRLQALRAGRSDIRTNCVAG